MILPISLTIAAAAAFTHFWLAFRCGRARMQANVSVGDGNSPLLIARMRAHANFTENTPIFLILLILVELADEKSLWLWAAGIAFIAGRIGHGLGMERPYPNFYRRFGFAASMLALIALAIRAIMLSYTPAAAPTILG